MKRSFLSLSLFLLILSSCEFKCNVGKTDNASSTTNGKSVSNDDASTEAGTYTDDINTSQIMNDIKIRSTGGIKVYRAILSKESGSLSKDNTFSLGESFTLTVSVEDGWKVEDGRSFLGASYTINAADGTQLFDTGDLFANADGTGLDENQAKNISLRTKITANVETEYYVVNFRIWDKKGTGEVSGSYNFKTK